MSAVLRRLRRLFRASDRLAGKRGVAGSVQGDAGETPAGESGAARADITARAEAATQAHDWPEAADRWERVVAVFGDEAPPDAYVHLSRAHRHQGDLERAAGVIERGRRLHPDDVSLAVEHGELALAGRDWTEATERWQALVDQFGDDAPARAFAGLAFALRKLGDLDQMRETIERGLLVHPDHPGLAVEHAALATAEHDRAMAVSRWQAVIDRFGEDAPGDAFAALGRLRRKEGLLADAAELVEHGRRLYPDHPGLAVEQAELAMARRDWDEAISRWLSLREPPAAGLDEVVPDRLAATTVGLMDAGELDLADALLYDMEKQSGARRAVLAAKGILLLRQRRFDEAKALWSHYWRRGITRRGFAGEGRLTRVFDTSGNGAFAVVRPGGEKNRLQPPMRVCVYTANYGAYDVVEPPAYRPAGVDFICLTDDPGDAPGWEVRQVDPGTGDAFLDSRRVKLLPHLYLDDYDASLYIDANLTLLRDPLKLMRQWLVGLPFVARCHPERSDVYDECEAILAGLKCEPEPIVTTYEFLSEKGMPRYTGMVEARLLWRDHRDQAVVTLMEKWWEQLECFGGRDQPHLYYALWATGPLPNVLPGAGSDLEGNLVFEKRPHRHGQS